MLLFYMTIKPLLMLIEEVLLNLPCECCWYQSFCLDPTDVKFFCKTEMGNLVLFCYILMTLASIFNIAHTHMYFCLKMKYS